MLRGCRQIGPLIFLLAILIVISFIPSLGNGFTNWDDGYYLTNNPLIRELSWNSVSKIFSHLNDDIYKPLVHLSFAVEYRFFGLNPQVYHATNLLLHTLNGILVFWLIFLLSKDLTLSFIVAVLFGIHPLRVESVAWISERKDMLYGFFFLLASISYFYYQDKSKLKFYLLSFLFYICALISKPVAVTLPLVLFLMDKFRGRSFKSAKIYCEKIPFFFMALVFGTLVLWTQYAGGGIDTRLLARPFDRLLAAADSVAFYMTKLLMPVNLSCVYLPPDKPGYYLHPSIPMSVVLTVSLILLAVFFGRRLKTIFFGSAYFLITIFPVLQLVPSGGAMAADRYSYLPSIGIFYMGASGLMQCIRSRKIHPILKKFFWSALASCILILSVLTWNRCGVWHDSISLWKDMVSHHPWNYTVYQDLGLEYKRKGKIGLAIWYYNRAVMLNPYYDKAYLNRGNAYHAMGDFDRALQDFNQALFLNPAYAKAYNSRGVEHYRRGYRDLAMKDFDTAILLKEGHSAYYNRGIAYEDKGDRGKAEMDYSAALALLPDFEPAKERLRKLKSF